MCLIVFAYKIHADYKLILVANRDEFYARPASVAHWWDDRPEILGGRDMRAKGTWMGISKSGRFACVTNYRALSNRGDAKSRGELPVSFLTNGDLPREYNHKLQGTGSQYNGFNLLTFDEEMVHFSNYENKVNLLESGIYGLSNALLDTPWPKVKKVKQEVKKALDKEVKTDVLFNLMQDTSVAEDDALPNTGLSYDMEKALSAICIRMPHYGTRCSTVVTIGYDDQVCFVEKNYRIGNGKDQTVAFTFKIEKG